MGVRLLWQAGPRRTFRRVDAAARRAGPICRRLALRDDGGCGFAHTVALCQNHEVLAWGSGFKGKLGLGDDQNRLTPTPSPSSSASTSRCLRAARSIRRGHRDGRRVHVGHRRARPARPRGSGEQEDAVAALLELQGVEIAVAAAARRTLSRVQG